MHVLGNISISLTLFLPFVLPSENGSITDRYFENDTTEKSENRIFHLRDSALEFNLYIDILEDKDSIEHRTIIELKVLDTAEYYLPMYNVGPHKFIVNGPDTFIRQDQNLNYFDSKKFNISKLNTKCQLSLSQRENGDLPIGTFIKLTNGRDYIVCITNKVPKSNCKKYGFIHDMVFPILNKTQYDLYMENHIALESVFTKGCMTLIYVYDFQYIYENKIISIFGSEKYGKFSEQLYKRKKILAGFSSEFLKNKN